MKHLFFTVLVFCFAAPVLGSENIRVAIADNQKSVTLASDAGLLGDGAAAAGQEKKKTFSPASLKSKPVRVKSKDGLIRINGKSYRGWLELRKKKNGLILVINDLDIEDYLKGVIASEIPHTWEFEALKAQAVASRSYALYQKRTVENRPYHIVATVNDQVYNGNGAERKRAVEAVKATAGMIIVYRGQVIPAFYHSSCGGRTENAAELWGIDVPYLKGVDCECQEISQYGLWERRMNLSKVVSALKRLGYAVNDVTDIGIENITPAGRVKMVAIRGAGRITLVPAETLRRTLGNTTIPSVFFELERDGNEAIFSGRGSGHGVGLCQWGTKEMAERGFDFRAILLHYYPGTKLARIE